jgi:hypothetical protein
LLGHFRHEIGHYYFALLIEGLPQLDRFRELFGDERRDYAEALARYYQAPPPNDWSVEFITAYASAHPWEDWAESFAHYLHMTDTLETAAAFGLTSNPLRASPIVGPSPEPSGFEALLGEWMSLSVALNALNRSMGLADPYPFQISKKAAEKLAFVHDVLTTPRARQPAAAAPPAC